MTYLRATRRNYAAVLLAALALALPRLLLPPGFMPASDHAGRFTLVFCDPALRAVFGGHVHSHGHDQAGGESCPFGVSGGPALLPALSAAVVPVEGANLGTPPATQSFQSSGQVHVYGARAPPLI
ncbi:MAG: DUF2946 family protein [Steroidobacteraceae bacterium]